MTLTKVLAVNELAVRLLVATPEKLPTVAAILLELKEPATEALLETVRLTTAVLLKLP